MRSRQSAVLLVFTFCGLVAIARSEVLRQDNTVAPQVVTLYPPNDKVTGKYDETRACFSFKLGSNKLPNSIDWDLGYGFTSIGDEDWLMVGVGNDMRSVMKELGEYKWSDSFKTPALAPLPELKEGEQRQITVDSSGDTHKQWAKTTTYYAKAKAGYMYLIHVKDAEADFYVLFRVEEIVQQHHCTISWKQIPTPER